MFSIDKNVPLTDRSSVASQFPFASMEVGDSFAVPKAEKSSKNLSAKARSWAVAKGHPDRKFSVRTNGVSVRIWRTA